ncbi:MAG: hypothetical protein WB341_06640, partial [Terracidiphilus sp.]
ADRSWKSLSTIGGITALISILLAPAEVVIGLPPGVQDTLARTVTVTDWFSLFQNHWFLGLRSLGLLNIAGGILFIPAILAVCSVLRRDNEAYAALGAILFFIGVAVYLAGSRAFPMLLLSHEYATAATDAQRALLAAAGQSMLAEAESRSGLLLIEFAFLVISAAMLKSTSFSETTAYTGMLASILMMTLEIAFIPPHGVGMAVAAAGGLAMMTWSFLVGLRLLQLGR